MPSHLGSEFAISVYTDGENTPDGYQKLKTGFVETWNAVTSSPTPPFSIAGNLKDEAILSSLPPLLKQVAEVRNPDLYLVEANGEIELGGVEITTHSPDGSNIEKRYPLLWISHRVGVNAVVATPYQKSRPSGQTNRFPHRHAQRNLAFLNGWRPTETRSHLQQLLPLASLQANPRTVSASIRDLLPGWEEVGQFFASVLILHVGSAKERRLAEESLRAFKDQLTTLATACAENTTHTEPSSLIRLDDRWIQVYNTRPDSGHWERGEGQFDSIDGRLMFTLDQITSLPAADRPRFEFWLPQMVSRHPWILEQYERGYGSKRLRNIMVVLADECATKFADHLSAEDWRLLREHPELLLERLDWKPAVYHVTASVPAGRREAVALAGLERSPENVVSEIETLLADPSLYFSSHRAYVADWESSLTETTRALPREARVLVPRIPAKLLTAVQAQIACSLVPAEACTKGQLMMLRQIHRNVGNRLRPVA